MAQGWFSAINPRKKLGNGRNIFFRHTWGSDLSSLEIEGAGREQGKKSGVIRLLITRENC